MKHSNKRNNFFQIWCNINTFVSKQKITAGIKKLLRILLFSATGFLLLVGVLYLLLQTPVVQTFLVKYVTDRVEKATGVKMQIGGVDFRPMRSLVLRDVLLRDFKNDTLVYCRDLQVKADSFSFVKQSFTIREIVLDRACFYLWSARGAGAPTNIEMFLDSLQRMPKVPAAEEKHLEQQVGWKVDLKKITVSRSHFTYQEEDIEPIDYGVNWTDIDCRDLNVVVTDFDFSSTPTRMTVRGLSLVEKSGLVIRDISGRAEMSDGRLQVTDGYIGLERSEVDLVKLEFRWTPDQHDWRYFTDRMWQYYELGPSSVSFIDLAYFNGILRGINQTVKCSGIVSNTIRQLEGHDLYIELGEQSVFQGSFQSTGLPDVRKTMFHIDINKAHLGPKDLAAVYLPWFDMNIPIPSPLYRLPYIDFEKIRFDGILSDFVVKANSLTPALAGALTFSYGVCQDSSADCSAMGGSFDFTQVDAGLLTGISAIGTGSVSGTCEGMLDERGATFQVNGLVGHLNVWERDIQGIEVALTWADDKLDLLASLDNKNIYGGAVMSYDQSDSLDFLSVRGKVRMNDLAAYGMALKGGRESAETSFEWVYAGRSGRNFTNLTLSDLRYHNELDSLYIQTASVEDFRQPNYNTTTLYSDVLDFSIEGDYKEMRPLPFVFRLLRNYLPAYSLGEKESILSTDQLQKLNFKCAVQVKDANRVLRVLYPDLRVSSGTHIVSNFHPDKETLDLLLSADTISYKGVSLLKSKINMKGDQQKLSIKYTSDQMMYGGGYKLYNVRDEIVLDNNHLDNKLSWCNWEHQTYSGELAACLIFTPGEKGNYTTEIRIHPGVIMMNDSVWRVNASSIFIDGKQVDVKNFSIRRGMEQLSVKGQISENPQDKLSISLENFNLANLTQMVMKRRTALFGQATGALTIQDYYKDFLLISDFNIDHWGMNQDTLGSLRLRSYWDAENRSVIVGAENRVGDEVPLSVSGYYVPATDSLSVNVKLQRVELTRAGGYLSDYVSETEGYLSGNVNVTGSLRKPDVSGFIFVDSVGFRVNALNTKFQVHDSILIRNNRLLFNHFDLRDVEGHPAVVNGDYQFWENRYQLDVRFKDFMVLNTGFVDNESFYGEMYLSGLVNMDNRNGTMNVTVNARAEEGSRLYIPLSAGLTEQSSNFLHFINTGQEEIRKNVSAFAHSDINLNANLELNEHLNVQVIFDPTVGDILKTTGNGNIKIAFDQDGSLSLFGEYQILRGDYLFTLSNLVNKKFVLTPGGTITWAGSPYDATLNINAVYSLKTTISELLPVAEKGSTDTPTGEEKTSESGRKVPVECILNLSERLTNPVVKFDINFPTLETQSKSYIQSLFSSQDEINKQMFSLLVLNHFYQTDNTGNYGAQAQTASVTTVTEMMSNQLSRWLSQISNNVDIGLAYRVRDLNSTEITSDEIEVALSTQLLNDRVTISANGNMDVGGTKNAAGVDNKKTNIAGDFDVEVKLNQQGTLKMKAYSHTDEKLLYNNTETIQGVGISYQESFDTLRELLRKYFGFLKRHREKNER
ncbi:MAG: translocation/assembly module TamB domain-containing protein [Odoribacter sp.]